MNPISLKHFQTTALALPDSRRVAQEAIAHNDMTRLQRMVHAGEVDGHTLTAEQRTLLIEAVRCLNINAFVLLTEHPDGYDLNQPDAEGNTLLHHLALRMTDAAMDDGGWEDTLEPFLENVHGNIEWDLENHDGRTALELAGWADRTSIAVLLDIYAPEPNPTGSDHAESCTDEAVFSDVEHENFDSLNHRDKARVLALYEQLLRQKRHR
jgi:hypothetical protein